jgi:hypothetical protein
MSALIAHDYSATPMAVDININRVGNSDVTKLENIAVKPRAAVVPVNLDKGTQCLQQES